MKKEQSPKNHKLPKIEIRHIIKFFYPLSIILVGICVYHIIFAQRIIPGVYIGNVRVGGMKFEAAKKSLSNYIASNKQPIEIKYENVTYQIRPDEISLEYNVDASIIRAFEIGRTSNIIADTKDKLAGLIKPLRIKANYEHDENALSTKFSQVKGELNKSPVNAKFSLNSENSDLQLLPSETGLRVNDQDLYTKVVFSLDQLDFSSKEIIVDEVKPQVTERDLISFKDSVTKIAQNPIKISYETKSWVLEPEQRLELISFGRNEDDTIFMTVNKAKLEPYIESISAEVNKPPRGKVTELDGDKVTKFEITQNGKEVNEDKFSEDFKDAFLAAQPLVELSMNEVTAQNSTEKYGIFTLLGTGRSKYTGSIPGRIHNLTLAAERVSGVLVPPGGTFSFNKTVGDISGRTGYNTAYIISNGRTVLGEGGGVCQTSTTLFRAVLNAGLPVVTRNAHAYRVSYYEIENPIGFDAAIFQPSLDFQFKNDTPNHVLVQAYPIPEENVLEFKIYGTPDGRTVEISEPVVTNVSGPPAPVYQDDPTLPKGTIKQVDWAAGGATVSFTRVVKKGNEVHFQDKYSSRYQPWRAVFLKGTKES